MSSYDVTQSYAVLDVVYVGQDVSAIDKQHPVPGRDVSGHQGHTQHLSVSIIIS